MLRIKIDMFLCSGSTLKMKNILKVKHNTPNFSKYVSADASAIFTLSLYYPLHIILCSIHNEDGTSICRHIFVKLKSVVFFFKDIINIIITLDACRVLKFTKAEEGRYLEHHVIQSILVDDNDFCQMKCYVEQTCSSYNLGSLESGDKFVCELSDSDHYQHPGDLVFKKGFSYHPAVVSILFQ